MFLNNKFPSHSKNNLSLTNQHNIIVQTIKAFIIIEIWFMKK